MTPMQVEISKENEKKIAAYHAKSKTIIPTYNQSPTGIVNELVSSALDEAMVVLENHASAFKKSK